MRRLDRYILGQLIAAFGFFVLIFTGVVWLTQAVRLIDTVVASGQSARVFLEFSALVLPQVLAIRNRRRRQGTAAAHASLWRCRMPGRAMIVAGTAMAVIIGTTILNFTFVTVSILFMLLLMRAGTLCLAPIVDLLRKRRISVHAWVGLALSLTAIAVALGGVDAYGLTVGAVLSLTAYLLGYAVRFQVMSVAAKTGDEAVDRRYFAEEQITAAVALLVICGLFAVIGAGPEMQALREGFTEFLVTPEALLGVMIGLFYSTLYVFGTLIYLDPREYTWAVPVNRASSVLAAAVASYGLTWLFGVALPAPQTLVAAGIVLLAVAALSYPQLRALTDSRYRVRRAAWSSSSATGTRVDRRARRRSCGPNWRAGPAAPKASSRRAPASPCAPPARRWRPRRPRPSESSASTSIRMHRGLSRAISSRERR